MTGLVKDRVEAVAQAWASIDGKLDEYDNSQLSQWSVEMVHNGTWVNGPPRTHNSEP